MTSFGHMVRRAMPRCALPGLFLSTAIMFTLGCEYLGVLMGDLDSSYQPRDSVGSLILISLQHDSLVVREVAGHDGAPVADTLPHDSLMGVERSYFDSNVGEVHTRGPTRHMAVTLGPTSASAYVTISTRPDAEMPIGSMARSDSLTRPDSVWIRRVGRFDVLHPDSLSRIVWSSAGGITHGLDLHVELAHCDSISFEIIEDLGLSDDRRALLLQDIDMLLADSARLGRVRLRYRPTQGDSLPDCCRTILAREREQ